MRREGIPMHDIEAKLMWDEIENGEVTHKTADVFVSSESITRNEFYASYQSGLNPSCAFKVNQYEYELSKHIEKDTNHPLFASSIMIDNAIYNIIRTFQKKGAEDIELICG